MRLQNFLNYLLQQGCEVQQRGNTYIVLNPANGDRASFHRSNPISDGIVKSVCRDLGIPSPVLQDVSVQQGDTSVTYHNEDVLSDIKYANVENIASGLSTFQSSDEESNVELGDISGCVALIGPIQICYSADLQSLVFDLSLKVGPITVAKAEISAAHPCISLNGSYKVAKWDLEICVNIDQKSITLSGKACALFLCKSFNITIFHW